MKKAEVQPKVQSKQYNSEPYMTGTSEDGCVMYWSDEHTSYRGETGEPITKDQ